MAQDGNIYEFLEKKELLNLLKQEGINREDGQQIEFNYALYYKLKDGRILVDPAIGKIGLMIKDEQSFIRMVEKKWFPVTDDGSFFAPERNQIKSIQDSIFIFFDRIRTFGAIELNRISDRSQALNKLSKGFNESVERENKSIKVDDSIFVALGVYLGEMLRQEVGGKWMFFEESTLNPYYVPYLEVEGRQSIDVWDCIYNHLNKRKKADFNQLYKDMLARIREQQSFFR